MFGLGPWELALVLIIVVFFYGGKRLSRLGEDLGRSVTAFKKAVGDDPSSVAHDRQESATQNDGRDGAGRIDRLDRG